MTFKKAIITTVDDWIRRDPASSRLSWLAGTLLLAPVVPIIVALRFNFDEPKRNPDFGKR